MKLALALMFAGIIHVSATSLGQTVTLSKKNVPMGTVLKDLQKQSGYNIFYDDNLVPENLRVSINLKNQPLDQALDDLLSQHGLDYHLVENNIILRKAQTKTVVQTDSPTIEKIVKQQQFRISGQVHDAQGHPLSNVSVKEKEATPSTMTDQNGDYTLQISTPDAIIEFSSIGYQKQEIALDDQTVLNITMKPMLTEVDEVVVVGYGEQKKVNLTGAVSQISGEEFEDRPVTQLTQALQGAVPNLNVVFGSGQPGTSGSVNVRGNTSINGGGPLILIDGILGTLDRVNVNDVESVTVLKDASAAAVYGARGAFGVILVTTKQGKEDGTASIDYSTNVGYTSHATNTDFITSGYWNAKINDDAMYNALG
ncbi:MAG: TonB-dependent receptor plug domain-containing protein, partial [Sphingobacterium sp.]